ncbi:hypothetical protein DdX_03889 [Ditylenchus destructor]|uniref:Uncharacterized protein n=1 Tax=Ditylenchus destructor TaxID=166010 RepID=A0AAD4NG42_9BILA|nr:hypothetical protein DdX_03889 [Ditylenchus destructor]
MLYSTTSLYQLLLTVEGQLQFRLGPDMKKNMPIDNVDFQWPDADQFRIGQDDEGRPMHLSKAPHWQGEANSNIREPVSE